MGRKVSNYIYIERLSIDIADVDIDTNALSEAIKDVRNELENGFNKYDYKEMVNGQEFTIDLVNSFKAKVTIRFDDDCDEEGHKPNWETICFEVEVF